MLGWDANFLSKVDVPNVMYDIDKYQYLSNIWFNVKLRMGTTNNVLKRDWITHSKLVNHYRCNSQQNWGHLHDHQ